MKLKKYNQYFFVKAVVLKCVAIFLVFLGLTAMATSSSEGLGTVAANIYGTFGNLTKLITGCSYIAGLGFSIGAIMKFKMHKDNPTQVPIGTPIALVFVAAALLFLPSMLSTTGQTVFGSSSTVSGPSGAIFT